MKDALKCMTIWQAALQASHCSMSDPRGMLLDASAVGVAFNKAFRRWHELRSPAQGLSSVLASPLQSIGNLMVCSNQYMPATER